MAFDLSRSSRDLIGLKPRSEAFPSLSMMSAPVTPAKPRIRCFPQGRKQWRCVIELRDIHQRKGVASLSLEDYAACGPVGWGDTPDRAYQAWKSSWKNIMEQHK